jgi:molecular chaperone DnaJ
VNVKIKPHPYFKRQGNDVLVELQINMAQAALGTVVKVPTLDGERQITIPAGVQSGTVMRMRGLGIQQLRGNGRGNQQVVVQVLTPTHLNDEQRKLLQSLGETLGTAEVVGEGKQSFKERIKDVLGL